MKEKQFEGLRNEAAEGCRRLLRPAGRSAKGQTDRESRAALAKAYVELGELTGKIGDQTPALEVHRKALAVHRALASEPDADSGIKLERGAELERSGWLQRSTGDMARRTRSHSSRRGKWRPVPATSQERGASRRRDRNGLLADRQRARRDGRPGRERGRLRQGDLRSGKNWPTTTRATRDPAKPGAAHNSIGLLQSTTGDPSAALPVVPARHWPSSKSSRRQTLGSPNSS